MGSLEQKVIIVTGGGSGFGKELTALFLREGANVAVNDLYQERIDHLKADLVEHKQNLLALSSDASKEEEVEQFINKTINQFGRVDILINNAAVLQSYQVVDTSLNSWFYQINNNLRSVFLMSRAVIPIMRAQRSGAIINISSNLGRYGGAGYGAYNASKSAIESLTHTIDEEESVNGIFTNVVNPGNMKTGMHATGNDPASAAKKFLRILLEYKKNVGIVIELENLS